MPPRETRPSIVSREFKIFKKKEEKRLTWFEFLARGSGKILKANPDENTRKEMESSIAFTGLRVTPQEVMSLVIIDVIVFIGLAVILLFSGFIPLVGALFLAAFGVGLSYYFLKYPVNLLKSYRMKASSQVVLAVLYMVVSMRISPNLEQALRFAAANVSGPLAWDMRRLLWDIEMGKYYSASNALTDYIAKWKSENEEFAEALRLIRDSQTQARGRSEAVLNESLDIILEGTKTRMKHYAQELSMPVTIIHMMGIILPVLGSIMAPLAAVFLANMVRPEYFVIGYNIVLPIFLVWFINSILKKRPTTFSQVDISRHPDLPPKGSFLLKAGEKRIILPVLPISIAIGLLFIMPFLYFFAENPNMLFPAEGLIVDHTAVSLAMSCFLTLGIGFSMASYFVLTNYQRIRIQNDILKTEGEFELALFQLGNRISGGTPTEVALEKSIDDVKDLSIAGLFIMTLKNIKNLGMTFRDALFHPKWGSIKYYPSRLIKNIMYMIVDITSKGFKYAADGMLTVSRYLRNIRETQEYIRDLLQESVSSMTFQAYMLTPLVTGLIVSMAQVIIKVLTILTRQLSELATGTAFPLLDVTGGLFGEGAEAAVSPEIFQLIIGIYLIEVVVILAMFLTKITQGENRTAQWYLTGKMLIVSLSVYFLVAIGSSMIFGEMITEAVSSLGIT